MLSLLLAAAISTITPDDYAFIKSQEDWVISNLPRPIGYHKYIPPEIAEQMDLWQDPCWRCRKHANEAVVAMGEPALRWMFWALRSANVQVQMHSEACIRGLIKCRQCNGSGICTQYIAKKYHREKWEWEYCLVCGRSQQNHEDSSYPRECNHCSGAGIFEHSYQD